MPAFLSLLQYDPRYDIVLCAVLCLVTQLCPTLCDPMDYSLPGSSAPGDSPGKNTEVGCRALLQGIFPTQESNPGSYCLLHWQVGSLPPAPPSALIPYNLEPI